ncbi:hypothetical protein BUALT_BualtMtG0001300 (mitochondrion) [Buddleja alternifolia]|uniref:Uncharacterized protein n=1 Tax=Buddleja alternifolia TaxID=168488 RepID=A0AAV6W812_9LAMI|nr:hypothetical protein BUALT_BualtMtG0001300 [Buddleja alternifolia]
MFLVQYLGCLRSWTSCSPDPEWILGEEPHLAVGKCSFLGRVQTGLKGGGISYSDLPGDSSLARAFESKHGHLLLRGSSRSSIEEPGRVNSKVPYSGCKAEEEGEWAQPHQQPAFPTRKELKMKEESVKECREELFPFHWFLKAINPRFPHIDSPSRIGSASDDEPMRKLSLLLAPDSEKDFSKFDQIDRESHHLLEKKPRKEEESLRQELGKQEGEARKGEARGSPSLGRLCPGSGNLSLASSGRISLCFITGSHSPVPLVFSSYREKMLTVTKLLSVDAEPRSSVEQHNEKKSFQPAELNTRLTLAIGEESSPLATTVKEIGKQYYKGKGRKSIGAILQSHIYSAPTYNTEPIAFYRRLNWLPGPPSNGKDLASCFITGLLAYSLGEGLVFLLLWKTYSLLRCEGVFFSYMIIRSIADPRNRASGKQLSQSSSVGVLPRHAQRKTSSMA